MYHFQLFKQVKRRYDGTAKLWKELPTDAELTSRQTEAETNQEVKPCQNTVRALSLYIYSTFWM